MEGKNVDMQTGVILWAEPTKSGFENRKAWTKLDEVRRVGWASQRVTRTTD